VVLEAGWALVIGKGEEQAGGFEAPEAFGEDVGWDVLRGGEKVAEAVLASEEVADNEQAPAVADELKRAGDGAERAAAVW
jgi:hypothetical protein